MLKVNHKARIEYIFMQITAGELAHSKQKKKTKFMPYTMNKEKFRRIIELHINGKFIDPIDENVVEHLCDLWLKKDFKKHK